MKNKWSEVLLDICILLLGIALVIWADKVTSIVSIILGVVAIMYGIIGMVNYFRNSERTVNDNMSFIYAIIIMVLGLVLVIRVNFLKELISFIVGIYILLSSILKLSESIKLGKALNTKLNGAIILAIVGIIVGILCIVGKFILPNVIVTYIGVLLIIYSVISIIEVVLLNKK